MRYLALGTLVTAAMLLNAAGCSTVPEKEKDREKLEANVDHSLQIFKAEDPTLQGLLDRAAGYAVFPSVGKGGFIAGAAFGQGHVFDRNGRWLGYSAIKQGTVGAQAGGQTYHELIVFKDQAALDKFKSGQYALAANYSAVAIKANAADSANFNDGVAVFVKPEGGAMIEASIGGQKFSFVPADSSNNTRDNRMDRTTTDHSGTVRTERTDHVNSDGAEVHVKSRTESTD